jgi:hypothetical protein
LQRGCWAASLGGCSPKITREHVVPESVLKAAQKFVDATPIWRDSVQLFRRQSVTGRQRTLSVASIVVKTLCSVHNPELSNLDAAALEVTKAVLAAIDPTHVAEVVQGRRAPHPPVHINGSLLERWALKTFYNACCARDMSDPTANQGLVPLSGNRIVDAVFRGAPLPLWEGIYFLAEREPESHTGGFDIVATFLHERSAQRPHPTLAGAVEHRRLPVYMVVALGPLQFAVLANITELSEPEWQETLRGCMHSGALPRGVLHMTDVDFGWLTPGPQPESPQALRARSKIVGGLRFEWTAPPITQGRRTIVINHWVGDEPPRIEPQVAGG